MGLLVLTPLIFDIWLIDFKRAADWAPSLKDLAALVPSASIVVISIYYFRVLLFNYRSAKSQLLQIDLRKTLCQFIQSYSEYSSEIKAKDKDALARFESVIFSGIVSTEENMPSTYDGIDQISKLIATLKK